MVPPTLPATECYRSNIALALYLVNYSREPGGSAAIQFSLDRVMAQLHTLRKIKAK